MHIMWFAFVTTSCLKKMLRSSVSQSDVVLCTYCIYLIICILHCWVILPSHFFGQWKSTAFAYGKPRAKPEPCATWHSVTSASVWQWHMFILYNIILFMYRQYSTFNLTILYMLHTFFKYFRYVLWHSGILKGVRCNHMQYCFCKGFCFDSPRACMPHASWFCLLHYPLLSRNSWHFAHISGHNKT